MPEREDFQRIVDVLWEVYRLQEESPRNTDLIRDLKALLITLADEDPMVSKRGGLKKNIADAICRTYLNGTLDQFR